MIIFLTMSDFRGMSNRYRQMIGLHPIRQSSSNYGYMQHSHSSHASPYKCHHTQSDLRSFCDGIGANVSGSVPIINTFGTTGGT